MTDTNDVVFPTAMCFGDSNYTMGTILDDDTYISADEDTMGNMLVDPIGIGDPYGVDVPTCVEELHNTHCLPIEIVSIILQYYASPCYTAMYAESPYCMVWVKDPRTYCSLECELFYHSELVTEKTRKKRWDYITWDDTHATI
jgi:hypothetical protein